MKKPASRTLTPKQRADLDALAALPDDEIDTSEMPEQTDLCGGRRGAYFRPIKKQITLRIDADLIEWFRQRSTSDTGYQTQINEALREYVTQHGKR